MVIEKYEKGVVHWSCCGEKNEIDLTRTITDNFVSGFGVQCKCGAYKYIRILHCKDEYLAGELLDKFIYLGEKDK